MKESQTQPHAGQDQILWDHALKTEVIWNHLQDKDVVKLYNFSLKSKAIYANKTKIHEELTIETLHKLRIYKWLKMIVLLKMKYVIYKSIKIKCWIFGE